MSLNSLACALLTRFRQPSTRMEDLEEGITCYREAHTLCPPDHADISSSLNNLANAVLFALRSWVVWKILNR
jgi:hypothetical protein